MSHHTHHHHPDPDALICRLIALIKRLLHLHDHKDDFVGFLTFDRSIDVSNLTVVVDDTGVHTATYTVLNLDGSPATGVTIGYSSDTTAVATVDPSSGVLKLVGIGAANITGNGTRGAFLHSDTGVLTVVADANTGDFTGTLGLA